MLPHLETAGWRIGGALATLWLDADAAAAHRFALGKHFGPMDSNSRGLVEYLQSECAKEAAEKAPPLTELRLAIMLEHHP